MTHSSKWIRSKRSEIHTDNSLIIHCSFVMSKYIYNIYILYIYMYTQKIKNIANSNKLDKYIHITDVSH